MPTKSDGQRTTEISEQPELLSVLYDIKDMLTQLSDTGPHAAAASIPVALPTDQTVPVSIINSPTVGLNISHLSAFGDLVTVENSPIFQGDFVYGINSQMWNYYYVFTVTALTAAPAIGDYYSNNNNIFTVVYTSGNGGTIVICSGTGIPTTPPTTPTLTRISGTGDATITYSAFSQQAGITIGTASTVGTNQSRLRIQSGTDSNSYAYVTSRKSLKYRAGQGVTARFTPIFSQGVSNNIQLWGCGTISSNLPYDGYFFGYNGTILSIAHYNAGAVTWYPQGKWNGDSLDGFGNSKFAWNPTTGSPVMIRYPYLGYGDINFYVQNSITASWILVHTIRYANTTASVQLNNPNLQFMGFTANSGNVVNQTMYCGSVGIFLNGTRSFIGNPKWGIDNNKASISSTETNILTLKNCVTYNGNTNRGLIRLNSLSFSSANNSVATLRVRLNGVIAGSPSYVAIDTGATLTNSGSTLTNSNSIACYEITGGTVSGGTIVFNVNIGSSSTNSIDLTPFDLFLAPGETMIFSAVASASSTLGVAVCWSEDI